MGHPFSADRNEREALLLFEHLTDPDLTPADRDELLAATTVEVRSIVRQLEAAIDRADARLSTEFPPATEATGARPEWIGPYRLIEPIGHGGMGEVWRAERGDGLFEHTVAIKLLSRGIFSSRSLAQFAEERRILARLRHPHVAQMFDGGVSPEGVPYIVMELIDGVPIDRWAERERLGIVDRIDLFAEAAEAVGYAHRNLIAHADLKPSNIVVEAGFGVKLLDFGIARLIDDTAMPSSGALTHAYASPARIAGAPATPADDMFAMGRLLRELVEKEPTCEADLIAVADKAAAIDPDSRYGTMAELTADLHRWRDRRPVSARAGTRGHRLYLFWRRNRFAAVLGTSALAALLVAIAIVTLLWLRAEQARSRAERRFAATHAMANSMLDEVDPQLGRWPGSLPVRRQLVGQAEVYLNDLAHDRSADPDLQMDIAAGYLRLARIYGLDVSGGLGDLPAAYRNLGNARALIHSLATRGAAAPRLLKLRGEYLLIAASELFVAPNNAHLKRDLAALQAAQSLFFRYLRVVPEDIAARLEHWRTQVMAGRIYAYRQQPQLSQRLIEPTLGNAAMAVSTPAQRTERDFIVNGAYLMLAESYEQSDPRRADRYYDLIIRTVASMQARGASDATNDYIQATAYGGRAQMAMKLGAPLVARTYFGTALEQLGRLLAAGPNEDIASHRALMQTWLADAESRLGHADAARALLRSALVTYRREASSGNASASRLIGLAENQQATVEHRAGNMSGACTAHRTAAKQWDAIIAEHAAMHEDFAADGPIEQARSSSPFCPS